MKKPPEFDPDATMPPPEPSENTRPVIHTPETPAEKEPKAQEESLYRMIERVQQETEQFTRDIEQALSTILHARTRVIDFRYLYDEGIFDVKFELRDKGDAGSVKVKKGDSGDVEVLPS